MREIKIFCDQCKSEMKKQYKPLGMKERVNLNHRANNASTDMYIEFNISYDGMVVDMCKSCFDKIIQKWIEKG